MPPTSFFLLGLVILSLSKANGQYVFSNDPGFFDPEQDDQSIQATVETNGRGLTTTDDQYIDVPSESMTYSQHEGNHDLPETPLQYLYSRAQDDSLDGGSLDTAPTEDSLEEKMLRRYQDSLDTSMYHRIRRAGQGKKRTHMTVNHLARMNRKKKSQMLLNHMARMNRKKKAEMFVNHLARMNRKKKSQMFVNHMARMNKKSQMFVNHMARMNRKKKAQMLLNHMARMN